MAVKTEPVYLTVWCFLSLNNIPKDITASVKGRSGKHSPTKFTPAKASGILRLEAGKLNVDLYGYW